MPDQRTSKNGIDLIKRFEGFLAEPEALEDGRWIFGFGQIRRGDRPEILSRTAAEKALRQSDLPKTERLVSRHVFSSLNQNEFDALVSFAYSLGPDAFANSSVVHKLNAGQRLDAACAIENWTHAELGAGLQPVEILMRRRAAEKALFLKPEKSDAAFLSARFPARPVPGSESDHIGFGPAQPSDSKAELHEDIRQRLIRIVGPDGIKAVPRVPDSNDTSTEAITRAVSNLAKATRTEGDAFIDDLECPDISVEDVQRAVESNERLGSRALAMFNAEMAGLAIMGLIGFMMLVAGLVLTILTKRAGGFFDGGLAMYAPGSLYILGGLLFVMGAFTFTAKCHARVRF